MGYQSIFRRYELKYLLTVEQKNRLLQAMEPYMALDHYGRTTIRNLYFDTDTYRLIRHSIEKPTYKEKLRIRSYGNILVAQPVFVELKKKYQHVVYKRRVALSEADALAWLCTDSECTKKSQIVREIDYFLDYYGTLHPTLFLSYEREAYCTKYGDDFRITFDDHIQCQQKDLSINTNIQGTSLLPSDQVLMEIKCSGGIPLWMTHVLTKEHIFKTSFSKYGTAYQTLIYPKLKEESKHARNVI